MVLSIGWWTKSLHGKWFFQLDDEPNLYMGNGSFNWMMNQIFTWEMVLSIGWWTKSLHGKWFFQLDDEPNLYMGNGSFNWMMNQIFTWEMVLSVRWWTKSWHKKLLFHHFHPFLTACLGLPGTCFLAPPPLAKSPRWHLTLLRDLADRLLLLSALLGGRSKKISQRCGFGRTRIQKHPGKCMAKQPEIFTSLRKGITSEAKVYN